VKGQQHRELASLPHGAGHFDAAVMLFHDPPGKRQTETGTVALGGEERPAEVGSRSRLVVTKSGQLPRGLLLVRVKEIYMEVRRG